MKALDLTRFVNAFERMNPKHLLFTKLDETGTFGPIFAEAARTRKPLSFFATGQRIPEDLEAVAVPRVLELLLGGSARAARVA